MGLQKTAQLPMMLAAMQLSLFSLVSTHPNMEEQSGSRNTRQGVGKVSKLP